MFSLGENGAKYVILLIRCNGAHLARGTPAGGQFGWGGTLSKRYR